MSGCGAYWWMGDMGCDLAQHGPDIKHATFDRGRGLVEWPEWAYTKHGPADLPTWVWMGEGA